MTGDPPSRNDNIYIPGHDSMTGDPPCPFAISTPGHDRMTVTPLILSLYIYPNLIHYHI